MSKFSALCRFRRAVLYFLLYSSLLLMTANVGLANVITLTDVNFDAIVGSADLALINFHAEWCRYSKMLEPVFLDASNNFNDSRIVFGSVDCDRQPSLAQRYNINKYPTLKLARFGEILKREYRGSRSVEAFAEYVRSQLSDTIQVTPSEETVHQVLHVKKPNIVLHVTDNSDSNPLWKVYRMTASLHRDDCEFHAVVGPQVGHPRLSVIGPAGIGGERIEFKGDLANMEAVKSWILFQCVPLVREITFDNAEGLTEEGLPFLILFYDGSDKNTIKIFKDTVTQQVADLKYVVNFLYADGNNFKHALHHLGKSHTDLPVIAIDSFRHMYLFPDFSQLTVPGKLRQFILDLQSGKLHRDFHNIPSDSQAQPPSPNHNHHQQQQQQHDQQPLTPVSPSAFAKLKPSSTRYTVLRDEL